MVSQEESQVLCFHYGYRRLQPPIIYAHFLALHRNRYLTSLYGSDGLTLHVSMGDLAAVGATMAQAKEATKTNIQGGSSAKLLSDTQTTVNGLTMYKMIFTITDPTNNQENKVLTAITGKEGQKVYYMQFIAETSVFDNNQKLMDSILNSVKVS